MLVRFRLRLGRSCWCGGVWHWGFLLVTLYFGRRGCVLHFSHWKFPLVPKGIWVVHPGWRTYILAITPLAKVTSPCASIVHWEVHVFVAWGTPILLLSCGTLFALRSFGGGDGHQLMRVEDELDLLRVGGVAGGWGVYEAAILTVRLLWLLLRKEDVRAVRVLQSGCHRHGDTSLVPPPLSSQLHYWSRQGGKKKHLFRNLNQFQEQNQKSHLSIRKCNEEWTQRDLAVSSSTNNKRPVDLITVKGSQCPSWV